MTRQTTQRPPDYQTAEYHNVAWTLLPRRASADGNLSILVQRFAPGGWFVDHRHDLEQFFLVTRGELEMNIGGVTGRYRAGDFVRVPRNVPHGGRNVADGDSEMVAVDYWPADSQDRLGLE